MSRKQKINELVNPHHCKSHENLFAEKIWAIGGGDSKGGWTMKILEMKKSYY